MFRSKKLLEAIRQCPCACCGAEDGTVAGAHSNEGKGMGMKASDALIAPLCFTCHRTLDQSKDLTREQRREMWRDAYIKGMQYMIETGILRVK